MFDTGESATLGDFSGTPLVVNLWSSWCPNCITEMPDFELVHRAVGDEVTFIGLNVEDDHAAAQELRETTGVTYLLGYDDDGRFPEVLGAFGMPATAFISATGEVLELWTGQLEVDSLTDKIAEHLLTEGSGESAAPSDPPSEVPPQPDLVADGVEAAAATADDTFDEDYLVPGAGAYFVPLDDPVLIEATEATWLEPGDIVMGVVGENGEAQAYPVDQMAYHHIANTNLAGEPFVVTY